MMVRPSAHLQNKKQPRMIPTKGRNDKKMTSTVKDVLLKQGRHHSNANLEFGSWDTKLLSAKAKKKLQRLR